jgi:LPXTG-motif cell wall-anchored protein
MQKTIGIILIVVAFGLGYYGIKDLNHKEADVKIGDVEISAKSNESSNKAYILIGAGVLSLIAGVVLVGRNKSQA